MRLLARALPTGRSVDDHLGIAQAKAASAASLLQSMRDPEHYQQPTLDALGDILGDLEGATRDVGEVFNTAINQGWLKP